MSNKYLAELEKLNKDLENMTDDQIIALFDDIDINSLKAGAAQYATLENFIVNSDKVKSIDPNKKS